MTKTTININVVVSFKNVLKITLLGRYIEFIFKPICLYVTVHLKRINIQEIDVLPKYGIAQTLGVVTYCTFLNRNVILFYKVIFENENSNNKM